VAPPQRQPFDRERMVGAAKKARDLLTKRHIRSTRRRAQDVAEMVFAPWSDTPVVLRLDDQFAGALMKANSDVEPVPDWLTRFPFDAVPTAAPPRCRCMTGNACVTTSEWPCRHGQ
jgi:hypothetical protein